MGIIHRVLDGHHRLRQLGGGQRHHAQLLARYPATTVAPFALLVPILGMSTAALFMGEGFSFWQLMGSVLVMTGLLINVFGGRIKSKKITNVVE